MRLVFLESHRVMLKCVYFELFMKFKNIFYLSGFKENQASILPIVYHITSHVTYHPLRKLISAQKVCLGYLISN